MRGQASVPIHRCIGIDNVAKPSVQKYSTAHYVVQYRKVSIKSIISLSFAGSACQDGFRLILGRCFRRVETAAEVASATCTASTGPVARAARPLAGGDKVMNIN